MKNFIKNICTAIRCALNDRRKDLECEIRRLTGFKIEVYQNTDMPKMVGVTMTQEVPAAIIVQSSFGKPTIYINAAMDDCTDDQIIAAMLHEIGHHKCGHLDFVKSLSKEQRKGYKGQAIILRNVEDEIEADAYASRCGYGEALSAYLRKVEDSKEIELRCRVIARNMRHECVGA